MKYNWDFLEIDLNERGNHHNDQPNCKGNIRSSDRKLIDRAIYGWENIADGHTNAHSQENPKRKVAVYEVEFFVFHFI